jgi:hypothetical protein
LFDYDILGRRKSKRQRRRETLAGNAQAGRLVQNLTEMSYRMQGYATEGRRTGCDFEAKRRNPLTGRTEHYHVEVKSSPTAPMRELQKRMRRKKGKNYRVERFP